MGRRSDPPGVQAAKGNPGRRKTAVARREERAREVADLLAASLGQIVGDEPPAIIAKDPVAVEMWRDLAPVLGETHRLKPQHRPMFYTFCVYYAQWQMANADLQRDGYTQKVKTIAGGFMNRLHPMVRVRDDAHKKCLELSKLFGLTPQDEYSLFKDQAAAATSNAWLFNAGKTDAPQTDQADEKEPDQPSLIGGLAALDSVPTGTRVN